MLVGSVTEKMNDCLCENEWIDAMCYMSAW